MSPRFVRMLVVAAAMLALGGCERLRDVKRCRMLARSVNPSLDKIEGLTQGKPTRADYEKVTLEYEAIAKSLDGFDGGTPELGKAVEEYEAIARSSARASSGMAQALGANNAVSIQLSTHELDRLSRQQKAIVRRIDDECQPR